MAGRWAALVVFASFVVLLACLGAALPDHRDLGVRDAEARGALAIWLAMGPLAAWALVGPPASWGSAFIVGLLNLVFGLPAALALLARHPVAAGLAAFYWVIGGYVSVAIVLL